MQEAKNTIDADTAALQTKFYEAVDCSSIAGCGDGLTFRLNLNYRLKENQEIIADFFHDAKNAKDPYHAIKTIDPNCAQGHQTEITITTPESMRRFDKGYKAYLETQSQTR